MKEIPKLDGILSFKRNTPKIVDHTGTLKFTRLIKTAPSFFISETSIMVATPVGNIPRYNIAIILLTVMVIGNSPVNKKIGALIKLAMNKECVENSR